MKCKRCGYKWKPLVEKPLQCPACKSYRWNLPYKNIKKRNSKKKK